MKKNIILITIISLLLVSALCVGYWLMTKNSGPYVPGGVAPTDSLVPNIQAGI